MNIALILAGGSGVRLGADIPKQYIAVQGKTVITHCLEVFGTHPQIDAIQIVAHVEWRESICRRRFQINSKDFPILGPTDRVPFIMAFRTLYNMQERRIS